MFKALDKWLLSYVAGLCASRGMQEVTDVLICVCDHFEPFHDIDKAGALSRIRVWKEKFPSFQTAFQDSDGVGPRHTFFYPIEQYDPDVLEALREVCALTGAEVEVHLHHDQDTSEGLTGKLAKGMKDFRRHGFLSEDREGNPVYGFIHGNWAINNCDPSGRNCGVLDELKILKETGCYADFTMPSAPHPSQTRTINRLYYASEQPHPKAHECGPGAQAGRTGGGGLLMVQGPLGLNWRERKWGILPRIENGDLTGANPPRPERLRLWVKAGVRVEGRPEWAFVKLHTHGGIEKNAGMLLGEPMRRFHQHLQDVYPVGGPIRYHYVTARELVNILHAAEEGHTGDPHAFRDHRYRQVPDRERRPA